MVGIAFIVSVVFIGHYFYKSASDIGKNGYLWLGIALVVFVLMSFVASLLLRYLFVLVFGSNPQSDYFVESTLGLIIGIVSLFIVNHFMNIIPD